MRVWKRGNLTVSVNQCNRGLLSLSRSGSFASDLQKIGRFTLSLDWKRVQECGASTGNQDQECGTSTGNKDQECGSN